VAASEVAKVADVQTWARLAAYVVSIGIGLEFAHRVYWGFNRSAIRLDASIVTKTLLSSGLATIPLLVAVGITSAFCKYVDASSLPSLGLTWKPDSALHLSAGMAIGGACVTMMFVAGLTLGWFRISKSPLTEGQTASVPLLCGDMTDIFMAAVFEELTMRGYVFTVLDRSLGVNAAIYGSAAIFSLFHLFKHPRIPLIFTINAFMFGVLAAQSRVVTGALWLPIGLHFGWNFAMGPVFGLPCAGRAYEKGLVKTEVDGPLWLTGGDFSPDAGVLGTIALTMAAAGLLALIPVGS